MRLSGRKSYLAELRETGHDFIETCRRSSLAFNLALQDIVGRYRGSILGPWWITIMTMSLVLGMGINYAALFHQPVEELLPYVAVGLVIWNFLSAVISEGGEAFVAGSGMIKQSALPLPLFILRCIIRNFINLGHQIIIIVAVLLWFHIFPGLGMLWSLAGLALLAVNLGWLGLLLAMFCTRFRDMPQIVLAVLQLLFFLSPIFWKPNKELAANPLVADNPFYFSIQSVREPLLHGHLPDTTFTCLAPMAIVGWIVAVLVYTKTRRGVVHYL
ncbi:MAG: ABC transporter permease [Caulobacteraceae bacterium]